LKMFADFFSFKIQMKIWNLDPARPYSETRIRIQQL
jgi:hypothetical protein